MDFVSKIMFTGENLKKTIVSSVTIISTYVIVSIYSITWKTPVAIPEGFLHKFPEEFQEIIPCEVLEEFTKSLLQQFPGTPE